MEKTTVGKRLKELRTSRGLTQTDIAKVLGVTKGAIQKYESGEIVNFKADTIRKLSEFFEVPPIYFIYDDVPHSSEDLNEALATYFGAWYLGFMNDFTSLTGDGQLKVIAYCKDLTRIPEYKMAKSEKSRVDDKIRMTNEGYEKFKERLKGDEEE